MGTKKDLRFIIDRELTTLNVAKSKIDLLDEDDLNDIFRTDRRDGVRSRLKDKIRLL